MERSGRAGRGAGSVLLAGLIALSLGLARVPAALAEPVTPTPTEEEERFPRGRSLLTLLLMTGALAGVALGPDSQQRARWTSRNGFDDGIRNGLVAGSPGGRRAAQITSDVLLGGLGAALLADWFWMDGRGEYTLEGSARADGGWVIANLLATQTLKVTAARQRPFVRECFADFGYVESCGDTGQFNKSFFSGHASMSATLAGLLCARHLARQDRDRTDWAICGGAATASLATGLLRITADQHFASDVLVGWGVGVTFGYVLPRVFDYRGPEGPFSRIALVPIAGHQQWGMLVHYSF